MSANGTYDNETDRAQLQKEVEQLKSEINRIADSSNFNGINLLDGSMEQKQLLRSLMNIRISQPISEDFLAVQDDYLQEALAWKGVTDLADLTPISAGLYLWQGDITTLRCDAIVNAANSGMTGCYVPCHRCIDNCIHTYAGMQLRQECAAIMQEQGHEEETGGAKITRAYNLPCKYVLHNTPAIPRIWELRNDLTDG